MATLILTAVGTAVGGPIGGAIGAFIGQQADLAIFGSGSVEGARLKELSVTTSSYGQPMPRHFGRMRVAGTVIWSTELIESSTKESGGKGQPSTKTYSYSASFAVALASTRIDRIGRIWADGELLRGAAGDLKVGGAMRTYTGTGDNPVDPLIAADKGLEAPAFRDCAYVVFEDLQLGDFGNRIPALTFEIFAPKDNSVSLGQLVPQSAMVSGEVLLADARGFSDEGGAVRSSLAAIDRVFPINCVTTAEGLSFSSSNTLPADIRELPQQLSAENSEDAVERFKRRGETIDRQPLSLRYYDEGRDYQPGVQRALGPRPEGRETILDLPAALSAQGARQLANSNAHRSRWQNEQIIWRIGELDPAITAGSVVRLPDAKGFWSVKSWEWFDRGIELTLIRLAPELGAPASSDAGTANTPVDLQVPTTSINAIEVPPSDGSDTSNPVLFAAVSAEHQGWRGANLFVEQGDALIDIGSASSTRAVVGTLIEPLLPSPCTLLEVNASVLVELASADLVLSSTDVVGLAMGENRLLVGGEVVQFLVAEATAPTRWKLSGLMRGRAGTEDSAQITHETGATATLLDDRLTRLDPSLVAAASSTRVAAIGLGDSAPVFTSLENAGLSRRPPMPVWPRAADLSDGSLELCWSRRARGQWRWDSANDVPLIEEQELYFVGFGSTEAPHVSWSVTAPRLTISFSERADILATYPNGQLWVRQTGTYSQSSALLLAPQI